MVGWKNAGKRRVSTGAYVEDAVRALLGVEKKSLTHQSRKRPDIYTGSIVGEIKAIEKKESRVTLTLEQVRRYCDIARGLNGSSLDGRHEPVSLTYYFAVYDGSGVTPLVTDVYVLGERNLMRLNRQRKVYGNYYIKDRVLMRTKAATDPNQTVFSDGRIELPGQEERDAIRKNAYEHNKKGLCIRFAARHLKRLCRNDVQLKEVMFHYDNESFKSSSASGKESGFFSSLIFS
ncbi:MAG: hypothetical protein V1887_03025 [Candidatus Aenigmatarchaeota archaeon]